MRYAVIGLFPLSVRCHVNETDLLVTSDTFRLSTALGVSTRSHVMGLKFTD